MFSEIGARRGEHTLGQGCLMYYASSVWPATRVSAIAEGPLSPSEYAQQSAGMGSMKKANPGAGRRA
jgi:hypothetical protein